MKHGFTLIELLAVITILGILAVITTPIVSKQIDKSRQKSLKITAQSIIKEANLYFTENNIINAEQEIDLTDGTLSFQGKIPQFGKINFDQNNNANLYFYQNGYCVVKQYEGEIEVLKMNDSNNCNRFTVSSDKLLANYDSKDFTINPISSQVNYQKSEVLDNSKSSSLIDYRIYGNTIKGENLFDGIYKGGWINNDGFIKNFSEKSSNVFLMVIPCKPNTSYSIYKDYSSGSFSVGFTDSYPSNDMVVTGLVQKYNSTFITSTSSSTSTYLVAYIFSISNQVSMPYVAVYEDASPSSPSEIKSLGRYNSNTNKYDIDVKVTGKNLLNIDDWYDFYKNNLGKGLNLFENNRMEDGVNTIKYNPRNGYNAVIHDYIIYPLSLKYDTQYTIKFKCKGDRIGTGVSTGFGFVYNDGSKKPIYCPNSTEWNEIIEISDLNKTVTGLYGPYNYGESIYIGKDSVGLYEGVYNSSNIPEDNAYKEQTTTISLDEPLRCVDDVCDYIDYGSKQIVKKIDKVELNGSETSDILYATGQSSPAGKFAVKISLANDNVGNALSNYFVLTSKYNSISTNEFFSNTYYYGYKTIGINPEQATLNDFKLWLQGNYTNNNPTIFYYKLATPITTSISLPKINIFKGYNSITVSDGTVNSMNNYFATLKN